MASVRRVGPWQAGGRYQFVLIPNALRVLEDVRNDVGEAGGEEDAPGEQVEGAHYPAEEAKELIG